MEIPIPCECGLSINVTEFQAGMRLPCKCGRELAVPSLSKLRRMSGRQADISPGLEIETMIANGELPSSLDCAICLQETDEIIDIYAICDTAEVIDHSSSYRLGAYIVFGVLGAIAASTWQTTPTIHGTDREQRLPVRVCSRCQPDCLRRSSRWPIVCAVLVIIAVGVAAVVATHIQLIGPITFVAAFSTWVTLHTLAERRDHARLRKLLKSEPLFVKFLNRHPQAHLRAAGREKRSVR